MEAGSWVGQVEESEDIVWGSCGQVNKVPVSNKDRRDRNTPSC